MKVITFLNEKGGVGKTTLSTHLAVGLALRGKRVIFIDSDPQANATTAFGAKKRPAFYDLVVREAEWADVITSTNSDALLVSGNHETAKSVDLIEHTDLIYERIQELADDVDYVIFDTSPTPSMLNQLILLASQYLIIPTQCERFSAYSGLPNAVKNAERTRTKLMSQGIDGCAILGIVPNQFRSNLVDHRETLREIQHDYADTVWKPVPDTVLLKDAYALGEWAYDLKIQGEAQERVISLLWSMVDRIEATQ
jgi:chromosome partitioning protein